MVPSTNCTASRSYGRLFPRPCCRNSVAVPSSMAVTDGICIILIQILLYLIQFSYGPLQSNNPLIKRNFSRHKYILTVKICQHVFKKCTAPFFAITKKSNFGKYGLSVRPHAAEFITMNIPVLNAFVRFTGIRISHVKSFLNCSKIYGIFTQGTQMRIKQWQSSESNRFDSLYSYWLLSFTQSPCSQRISNGPRSPPYKSVSIYHS